jgi:hypothetical protein
MGSLGMTKQISYTEYEREMRPQYRQMINASESTEDVKKFFVRTVLELFEKVFEDRADFKDEDVHLDPEQQDGFVLSKRLRGIADFASTWKKSDLPHIVRRMAEFAMKRHKRLEQHRDKTEAKMYPTRE